MWTWANMRVSFLVDEYAAIGALPPVETPVEKEPEKLVRLLKQKNDYRKTVEVLRRRTKGTEWTV